jgi:hypothetical protein
LRIRHRPCGYHILGSAIAEQAGNRRDEPEIFDERQILVVDARLGRMPINDGIVEHGGGKLVELLLAD